MPIPVFDHNHVLPPHLGNPAEITHISPYECTIEEVCTHFAITTQRIEILKGLVSFRLKMTAKGIISGFQWLDGSFTEDIERSEGRAPNDLDVVTFYKGLSDIQVNDILANFGEFANPSLAKATYKLDHYPIDYASSPELTVAQTRYWFQLFTHNRNNVWKGILHLPLNTPSEDQNAFNYLNSL
ncbi:MAG: hypothetical protein AAGB30_10780 [Pedobacter sp.]